MAEADLPKPDTDTRRPDTKILNPLSKCRRGTGKRNQVSGVWLPESDI